MITPAKTSRFIALLFAILFIITQGFAQSPAAAPKLEKMPVALETDFALSSLPPYLRSDATIYLLDPAKGYYLARKGSNGFVCFVTRTAWEWAEFRNDIYTAISFDAEGAKVIFPLFEAAEAMRSTGKYTALQTRNIILDRIRKGIYKAPARAGVSYMLAPVMRTYPAKPDQHKVMTMKMPHYMFYAPGVTNADIGNIPDGQQDGPFIVDPEGMFLGDKKAPYAYIIVPAGEKEAAKISADNKGLMKRLADYRAYLK